MYDFRKLLLNLTISVQTVRLTCWTILYISSGQLPTILENSVNFDDFCVNFTVTYFRFYTYRVVTGVRF
jgi:hypothetical protein